MNRTERTAQITARAANDFKDHQLLKNENHTHLQIGRPGTSIFWAEIVVLAHGHLLVHGDIDAVIFGRFSSNANTPETRLENILGWVSSMENNDGYAMQKVSIGMSSRDIAETFDDAIACDDIDGYIEDHMADVDEDNPENTELTDALRELKSDIRSGEADKNTVPYRLYDIYGDGELCNAGRCIDSRVVYAIQAVKRLMALLKP